MNKSEKEKRNGGKWESTACTQSTCAYQTLKTYNQCNGFTMALLYLPYNGRHHCLVWEKKANDLNETRE